MRPTAQQIERAAGALLGGAIGDALGVPYEFVTPRLGPSEEPRMTGGGRGGYAPGEYSTDTRMAVCIADVASTGADLRGEGALDQIAAGFLRWLDSPPGDIDIQTTHVLHSVYGRPTGGLAAAMRAAAADLHERTGLSAGNG